MLPTGRSFTQSRGFGQVMAGPYTALFQSICKDEENFLDIAYWPAGFRAHQYVLYYAHARQPAGMDKNLFIQKYLLQLPAKDQLEKDIQGELKRLQ